MSDMPEEYGEREHISVKFFVAGVVLGFVLCWALLWTAMTYGRPATATQPQAYPFTLYLVMNTSSGGNLELIAGSSNGTVMTGFNFTASLGKALSLVKAGFGGGGKYLIIQTKLLTRNVTMIKSFGAGIIKVVVKRDGKVIATGEVKISSPPSTGTTVYKVPLKWVAGKPELWQVTSVYICWITSRKAAMS